MRSASAPTTVSVITPSFNQGQFLSKAIESVLDQQGNFNIEYIIVDGCSIDNSMSIGGVTNLKILEALACGCPVACSKVAAIPAIIGEAVLFFDPTSKEDIVDKIWTVWNDASIRERLVPRGFKRAKLFQWDKTAKETIEVYRKAPEISSRGTVFPDRGATV